MKKFYISTHYDNEKNKYVIILDDLVTNKFRFIYFDYKSEVHRFLFSLLIQYDFTNFVFSTNNNYGDES